MKTNFERLKSFPHFFLSCTFLIKPNFLRTQLDLILNQIIQTPSNDACRHGEAQNFNILRQKPALTNS